MSKNEFSFICGSSEQSLSDKLIAAIDNSPDVFNDILSSLGYEIALEDYKYTEDVPIYETVSVTKTRDVPCGFPCFYRTETYTEDEQKFKGYEKVERVSKRFVLRKKS